jgi:hypothetical protein
MASSVFDPSSTPDRLTSSTFTGRDTLKASRRSFAGWTRVARRRSGLASAVCRYTVRMVICPSARKSPSSGRDPAAVNTTLVARFGQNCEAAGMLSAESPRAATSQKTKVWLDTDLSGMSRLAQKLPIQCRKRGDINRRDAPGCERRKVCDGHAEALRAKAEGSARRLGAGAPI